MSNSSSHLDEPAAHVAALRQAFPRLFNKGCTGDVWFPPGWADILRRLCFGIDCLLDDRQARLFCVRQVKEKFATLRFYYAYSGKSALTVDIVGSDGSVRATTSPRYRQPFPAQVIDALIAEAERKSGTTCAVCGAPGVLRTTNGWLHVSCERCEQHESI